MCIIIIIIIIIGKPLWMRHSTSGFYSHKLIVIIIIIIIIIITSFYRSPNIVRVIKSSRLRWEGHVVRMEEGRSALKIFQNFNT